ncbi:MAG: hypothetical protein AAGI23_09300 [Bacteroidota bacterium]
MILGLLLSKSDICYKLGLYSARSGRTYSWRLLKDGHISSELLEKMGMSEAQFKRKRRFNLPQSRVLRKELFPDVSTENKNSQ